MNSATVQFVLSHYSVHGAIREFESLGGAGGFSGAHLWRVTTPAARWCLRRWPAEHPTPERLQWLHAVLRQAGEQLPFIPVPAPVSRISTREPALLAHLPTSLSHAGHLWELTPWLPGMADYQTHPSRNRLAAAFQALARFHQATVPATGPKIAAAPTFLERRDRLQQLQHFQYEAIARVVHQAPPLPGDCGQRLLRQFPRLAPDIATQLAAAAALHLPLQPAIRDVWHDHVLFTGEEVSGLVDFGALRIDTPLADVARLVGSLAGDDLRARDHALAAYAALCPLSDQDRRLIDLLDQSGTLLAGCTWLQWLYLDCRTFDDLPAIFRRLQTLVHRLERWEDKRRASAP